MKPAPPASCALADQPYACPTSVLEADHPGIGLLGHRIKIIHSPQLDPLIERRVGKTGSIDTRKAGPERQQ
jgi:hypothetical protein